MFDLLLKDFNYNTYVLVGVDGRYHTVYCILFDTGHFYIGKHTSDDLKNDEYFGSGILPNHMRNLGHSFERRVLFYMDSSAEALYIEKLILESAKYFNDPLCLNCYPGSPPDATGTIIVSKGNKFKMINPKLLEYFLSNGWERKGIKRYWINNGNEDKFVLYDDFISLTTEGWIPGPLHSKDRIFIEKDNVRKFIKKDDLDLFLSDGWVKKHNVEGTKVLRKGTTVIKVSPALVDSKIAEGFLPGSTVDGLIYIRKNKEYKRVQEHMLDLFLSDGWVNGNNASDKIYINNGAVEHRIDADELLNYPDFTVGRLTKIYLNNGIKERRLPSINIDEINKYIADGYSYGKLIRQKQIQIYKENKVKRIAPHELDMFLSDGWTDVFDKSIHYHPKIKKHYSGS